MEIAGKTAVITGGASGLGAATAREIVARGGNVVLLDLASSRGAALAAEISEARARFMACDVTSPESLEACASRAIEAFGEIRIDVNCAGIGWASRTVSREGPHPIAPFERVIAVNLIGTFNAIRIFAARMAKNAPDAGGERGVIVNTASIAAFDGQIGQVAYAASKGGVVGMTLPVARDLASLGVRCCTIAPGLFDTPLLAGLPDEARQALAKNVPFPPRLGQPAEYAHLACAIIENPMLNGETVRLDAALRMPPRG
jgi:NAD(P)-dependent dehydrogenase (short-subunit alcohol dehydrogenase family)